MSDSSFFSQFLMITNINTIVFILAIVFIFMIIKRLENNKTKFSKRIIYATIMGIILGVTIQIFAKFPSDPTKVTWMIEVSKWYNLFGLGFMDLLKMLVVPMVFASILRVIINIDEGEKLKKLTFASVGMLLLTTVISAIVGIVVAEFMNLGINSNANIINSESMKEITPLVDTLRGMIPSNVVEAMVESNIVGVIVFAVFLGTSINRLNKKYKNDIKVFVDFIEAFYKIIVSVSMTVIKFMPYAVVAMISNTLIINGIKSILSVVEFIIAFYISSIILFIIHMIILYINSINPIKYIKNASEPLILAFTSRSSLGTLPVTIETLINKHNVDEGVASFTASLGANMGMNGCAGIYPSLMAITIANMAGIDKDISFYIMLLVVIAISSLGIAGLPGTATMAVSVVVSGIGLGAYFPLASGIIAIDPILDMGRTMINVNGASISAIIVNKNIDKK